MEAFDALITRDGSVYHVAWQTHTGIIAHFGIPENTSMVRQNYWEYDLRVPFSGTYNGLQARGIKEPPEVVVNAAERLTGMLRNWHHGRDLESIPPEWGDLVEHVYGVLGEETPRFLNGRGGVFFRDTVEEMVDGTVRRLIGSARVRRLAGAARIDGMWGRARVEEMVGESRIGCIWEAGSVGRMRQRSVIEILCQSAVVEEMWDRARVMIMHGASRVLALHDSSLAARACDGVVCTPDPNANPCQLLSADERWKQVKAIEPGDAVLA